MSRAWTLRTLAMGVGRAALVVACGVFFVWLFVNGGVPRFAPSAQSSTSVEDCGRRIAGSGAFADRLLPELARDFLRGNGFAVAAPARVEGGRRVVGVRNGRRCTLTIETASSADSLRALAARQAAASIASRPISPSEMESLRNAGGGDLGAQRALMEHVIALDAIVIIVNASNRVEELSLAQAKRIFLGETEDWSEIGAAAGPIRLHARSAGADAEPFFVEAVLNADPRWSAVKRSARAHASEAALIEGVARDPNGIAFVSAAFLEDARHVRPLALSLGGFAFAPTSENVRAELYPLPRRLFLYTRANEASENALVRGFIRYVKSEPAFDIMDRHGHVSPRSALFTAVDNPGANCLAGAPETFAYRAAVRGAERLPVILRFLSDASELDSLARDDIARHASALRDRIQDGAAVKLIGHSDSAGAARENRALGLQRAEIVRQAFEAIGVYGLQIESAGEACPAADNESARGQGLNRRVEIWIAANREARTHIAAGKR